MNIECDSDGPRVVAPAACICRTIGGRLAAEPSAASRFAAAPLVCASAKLVRLPSTVPCAFFATSAVRVRSATIPYRPAMLETPRLHPANSDELAEAMSFALRYDDRQRVHHADTMRARIMANRLVRYLERSGFVVMKKPPTPMHSASTHPPPQD
jgi:hypothetical protein